LPARDGRAGARRASRRVAPRGRGEAAFQVQVLRNLRRNYTAHLAHGLLGQTGMRLVNAPTFLPAYVYALAGNDLAVGAARALQYLGMMLSPIVGATWIEHRRRVLPVGFLAGGSMRLMILGIALAGLLLPAPWPLLAVWIFLGGFGFFLGIQGVVFNFLIAKVIPVGRRGLLLGLRNAIAGTTAAVVSLFAGRLVDGNALGNGYAATFLLAFVLTSLGLAMLLFVREPATPEVRRQSRVRERLGDLPALLRGDPAFTRYFLARSLGVMGRMGVPFYVLYASGRIELGGARLGILTGAFVLAQSIGNLVWGPIADRRGFRLCFLASLGLWIGAVLLLMRTTSFAGLAAVFAGLGAGLGGFQLSAQNLVLEFGSRANLPLRIAVANSAAELVAALGALLGGVLAMLSSYTTVFWTATAFQLAGLAAVALWVDEPRQRTGT
jgi:MFS family permease